MMCMQSAICSSFAVNISKFRPHTNTHTYMHKHSHLSKERREKTDVSINVAESKKHHLLIAEFVGKWFIPFTDKLIYEISQFL